MRKIFLLGLFFQITCTSAQLIVDRREETVFDFQKQLYFTIDSKMKIPATIYNQPLVSMCSRAIALQNCISISDSIYYRAFFCRMENKINNKFNVRIIMRAGNDKLYQLMLEEKQELPLK